MTTRNAPEPMFGRFGLYARRMLALLLYGIGGAFVGTFLFPLPGIGLVYLMAYLDGYEWVAWVPVFWFAVSLCMMTWIAMFEEPEILCIFEGVARP